MGLRTDWQKYKKDFKALTGEDFPFKKGDFAPTLAKVDTAMEALTKARDLRKKGLNDTAYVAVTKRKAILHIEKAQDTGDAYIKTLNKTIAVTKKEYKEAKKQKDGKKEKEKKAYMTAAAKLLTRTEDIVDTLDEKFEDSRLTVVQEEAKKSSSGKKSVMMYTHNYGPELNSIMRSFDPKSNVFKRIPGDLPIYVKYVFKDKGRDQTYQVAMIQKIAENKTGLLQIKLIRDLTRIYYEFYKKNMDASGWLQNTVPAPEIKKLDAIVWKAMQDTNRDIVAVYEDLLKKKAKGKAHRSGTKLQAVRHVWMPVVSGAGAVLGVVLAAGTLGLALPLAAIAIHKSAVDIKKTADFASGRYRSTKKLELAIFKNAAVLQERSDDLKQAVIDQNKAQSELERQEAEKDEAKIKHKIGEVEKKAAAMEKFFSIRTKSITTMEHLLGKYEKKIYEHYFDLYSMGKQIDKHNKKARKYEQLLDKYKDKMKNVPKDKDTEKITKLIKEMRQDVRDHDTQIIQAQRRIIGCVNELMLQEKLVKKWLVDVRGFKKERPDSVKNVKRLINFAAFTEDVAVLGLGGAGSATDATPKVLEKAFAAPKWLTPTQATVDATTVIAAHIKRKKT